MRLQADRAGSALLLADCIEIKSGFFQPYLMGELFKRADHRCVTSLADFRRERRAVTQEARSAPAIGTRRTTAIAWTTRAAGCSAGPTSGRSRPCARNWRIETSCAQAAADYAASAAERDGCRPSPRPLARLDTYESWDDLDVADAQERSRAWRDERARLVAGSSRLTQIAEALQRNREQSDAVAGRIAQITGELARTAQSAEQANRAKRRDDDFVASRPAAERTLAAASYEALGTRLGATCRSARGLLGGRVGADRRLDPPAGPGQQGAWRLRPEPGAGHGRGASALAGAARGHGRRRRFPQGVPGLQRPRGQ